MRYTHCIKKLTRTMKGKSNCLFCDSARHNTLDCNSVMKGKYNELREIMKSEECPDFQSYNMKELKLIAFETPYEKSLYIRRGMNSNQMNRKYGRNPIPLTLSKNQMVKSLKRRWEILNPIVQNYNNGPNTETTEECPICYDNKVKDSKWDNMKSDWIPNYTIGTVKTICNHYYCGDCWQNLKKIGHHSECKSCPLCRNELNVLNDIWVRT